MHLKILIGVLTLGLAAASPKAAAKPAAKASPQYYSNGQPFSNFGENYAAQAFPGHPSSGYYDVRYSPSNYGHSSGTPNGYPGYPQASSGNYYQQPQLIPVPVAYSSSAGNDLYNDYNGGARLWPKNLVSPTGSPSPVTASSSPLFYPSSTPSPVAYQSTGNYLNSPYVLNSQAPVSTPSPLHAQNQPLIPVPVKVGLRNSFHPEVTNYNTASYTPQPTHLSNYQQHSTPASYLQHNYQKPTAIPYTIYQQQATGGPYVAAHQHPTASPYQVNYQHQPYNYQHQPYSYQQQPYSYHQQPYSYQQSTVSPFVGYQQQPTSIPYVAQYQQPAGHHSANYQSFPVPVAYPYNQIKYQPTKPTFHYSVTPTPSYPSIPVKSKPISIIQPTNPTPTKIVSITEKPYVPSHTTHTSITKPKATIIKSEYNSGTVSPQYNVLPSYSTTSPFDYPANQYLPQSLEKSAYGIPYVPSKPVSGYSPSTAVSHVTYNGLGTSYSYKK